MQPGLTGPSRRALRAALTALLLVDQRFGRHHAQRPDVTLAPLDHLDGRPCGRGRRLAPAWCVAARSRPWSWPDPCDRSRRSPRPSGRPDRRPGQRQLGITTDHPHAGKYSGAVAGVEADQQRRSSPAPRTVRRSAPPSHSPGPRAGLVGEGAHHDGAVLVLGPDRQRSGGEHGGQVLPAPAGDPDHRPGVRVGRRSRLP